MLQLIWGLLNIALFIYFAVLCYKAAKLLKEKKGTFAAVIFVLVMLFVFEKPNANNENLEPNSNKIKTWKFVNEDSLKNINVLFLEKHLEKTLVSTYDIGIQYYIDEKHQCTIPMNAYSTNTGFILGIDWTPMGISVNKTIEPNFLQYSVYGKVEWKLLNLTIYTQRKEYQGIVNTRNH